MLRVSLREYAGKRDFSSTPEPKGKVRKTAASRLIFVIQKHKATRLHYDLRLEMDGALKSWAVPKGPSLDPAEKRLAVQVEDHPLDYGDFEGIIPEGNYGAGTVIVWDKGTYQLADGYDTDPLTGWTKGKLHLRFHGKKLQGIWVLVRIRGSATRDWLLFKKNDDQADPRRDITQERPESVKSGRTIEELEKHRGAHKWNTQVERQLENLKLKDGDKAPMPQHVGMMLATPVQEPFDSPGWLYELKHDGVRALAYKKGKTVRLVSRNGLEMRERFPEIREALARLPVNRAIVDGEIVALDNEGRSSFQLLQPRIHLRRQADVKSRARDAPACFVAFDLLYCNGYLLTRTPLWKRKESLKIILSHMAPSEDWAARLIFSEHIEADGKAFYDAVAARHLEGIVAKHRDSFYESRRSRQWLKIKCSLQQEFVVVGFTEPKGSRRFFGSLLLGLYKGDRLLLTGSSGGGFDDRSLRSIYRSLKKLETTRPPVSSPPAMKDVHWVKPQLVARVRFAEWTREKMIRHPVFLGLREDKDARDCRLEANPKSRQVSNPAEEKFTASGKSGDTQSNQGNSYAGRNRVSGARNRVNAPVPRPQSPFPRRSSNSPFKTEHPIIFSNLNKVLWPEDGYTKQNLIAFYDQIAPFILPHLKSRPLNLERFPDGIHGESFYQKNMPDYFPEWIARKRIYSSESSRYVNYTVCNDHDTLLYLANLACIPHNPWSSRVDSLDNPDFVLFDLDPEEAPFSQVQEVASKLLRLLDSIELDAHAKTSGATGIHIFVPIKPEYRYQVARQLAELVGILMLHRYPDLVTLERVVKKRTGKVYIDYLQNGKGKTVVGPYVLRPRTGAPVSTPLTRREIEQENLSPTDYNIKTIFRRLDKVGDLFKPVLTDKQSLKEPLQKLESLLTELETN